MYPMSPINSCPLHWPAFVYEGAQYGLPYAAENVAFLRNTELVPENPETWEDVRAVSEAADCRWFASQYGFIMFDNNPYHFFPVQTAFGGYVFGLTDEGYDPKRCRHRQRWINRRSRLP